MPSALRAPANPRRAVSCRCRVRLRRAAADSARPWRAARPRSSDTARPRDRRNRRPRTAAVAAATEYLPSIATRRRRRRASLNGRNKSIPPLRDGVDVVATVRRGAEDLAQRRNRPRQTAFLDRDFAPDLVEQVLLPNQMRPRLARAWSAGRRAWAAAGPAASPKKQSFPHVKAIRVEHV